MTYTFTHNGRRVTVPIYAFGDQRLASQAVASGYVRLPEFSREHGAAFPNEAAGILVPPDVARQYLASMEPQPSPTNDGLLAVVGGGGTSSNNPNVGNPLFRRGAVEPGGSPRGSDPAPARTPPRLPTIGGLGYNGEASLSGRHYRTSPDEGHPVRVMVPDTSRPRGLNVPRFVYINPSNPAVAGLLRETETPVPGMPGVTETSYRLERPR